MTYIVSAEAEADLEEIGDSRGIRIPKTLRNEAELPEKVELYVEPGRLVVEAARRGWAIAAKRMRARAEEQLLDEPTTTRFDREEREWQ